MVRVISLAVFLLLVFCVIPGDSLAQERPGPVPETINVTSTSFVPLSKSYRRLERIYRRFESFPGADRAGLTLHLQATLQPGDRPGYASGLMLRNGEEIIHLIPNPGSEIIFPRQASLWAADPMLYARLRKGETLSVSFFFTVMSSDPMRFTGSEARHWLTLLDRCVRDEGGFLIALLLPDTHRLTVEIAPGSRFDVIEAGVTHLLVDNRGEVPYRFVFRPQDYPRDAVFRAGKPFARLIMYLPFPLHGALERK
ncbi:hypothetical protein [Asaia prunellae]|uniref:hypothetical protein n=1 Tax=Asaia prunellae TaxID=610245 RepID=UPI000470DCD5|nr:hypothetical protein [Asaia prunellae]